MKTEADAAVMPPAGYGAPGMPRTPEARREGMDQLLRLSPGKEPTPPTP